LKWSISESTPAGAATVNAATGLVTAIKGGTVTVRATALDGSSTIGEIILEISGTAYPMDPITGSNGTYNTYCWPGAGRWMIQNSKEGTPSYTYYSDQTTYQRGYYYSNTQAAGACPMNGWALPTQAQLNLLATYFNANKSTVATILPSDFWAGLKDTDNAWRYWNTSALVYGASNAGLRFYTDGSTATFPYNGNRRMTVLCLAE
jgi:uncharacterized protein (TIGR02145 family)